MDEDPGWPLITLVPFVGPRIAARRRREQGPDGLRGLRAAFLAFCSAVVVFQFILLFAGTSTPERPRLALVFLAVGALCVALGFRLPRHPRAATSAELRKWYVDRFFKRIALSEAAAILGFVGFFVTNERWVYPIAVLVTLVGFAGTAPTRRSLDREQQRLLDEGIAIRLVAALRSPPLSAPDA